MKIWKWLFIIVLFVTPAYAWKKGGQSWGPGRAQINIPDFTAQVPINLFNAIGSLSYNSGATPAAFDQYMYPVRNFSGRIGMHLGEGIPSTLGPWVMGFDAGRSCFQIEINNGGTVSNISPPGAVTVVGNGTINTTITGNCGQAESFTFTYLNLNAVTTAYFNGSYTSWNLNTTGRWYWVRQSDLSAYLAGRYWTPEFISGIQGIKPETVRFLGWNSHAGFGSTGSNVVNWGYRRTVDSLMWNMPDADFPPGTRCGTRADTAAFCTMSVSASSMVTAAPAADTNMSNWVDGEQITGILGGTLSGSSTLTITDVTGSTGPTSGNCKITVADTSVLTVSMPVTLGFINGATECRTQHTTILSIDSATQFTVNTPKGAGTYTGSGGVGYITLTITGKSGGSKLIWGKNASLIQFETFASGSNVTFTYNATLDAVLLNSGGITNGVPLEAQLQLANAIGTNFWITLPAWANDNFNLNTFNTIYSGLNPRLKMIAELANEFFNVGQQTFQFSVQMGAALGINTLIDGSSSWQGLRNRMIFGQIKNSSNWSSSMSRVERAYCVQSGFSGLNSYITPMRGASLISPGTAAYQTYVGGSAVNYDTYPNRPVDYTDTVCSATYIGGGTPFSGQSIDSSNYPPVAADLPALNSVVSYTNSGNINAANAIIDGYIRGDLSSIVLPTTASGTTFTATAHGLTTGAYIRFTATGGTAYSNINLLALYKVSTTPTADTFTVKVVQNNGDLSALVNAGSAGSGTMYLNWIGTDASPANTFANLSIFGNLNLYMKLSYMAQASNGSFSPAPAGGDMGVRAYEGNLVPTPPSSAQCTSLSISAGDCTTLATAVTNWRNSSTYAIPTAQYHFTTFMGTASDAITYNQMPTARAQSWFMISGSGDGGIYALKNGDSWVSPYWRQTYYGVKAYSAN